MQDYDWTARRARSIRRLAIPALTGCRTFRTSNGSFCVLCILLHVGWPGIALVSCCRHCTLHTGESVVETLGVQKGALLAQNRYSFYRSKSCVQLIHGSIGDTVRRAEILLRHQSIQNASSDCGEPNEGS